jgi:hypothetical protein
MPASFIQALAYRRGGKVLLMLGLFAVLSLAFATFGPDQVLAGVPDKAPFRQGVRKHIMKSRAGLSQKGPFLIHIPHTPSKQRTRA